MNSTLSGNQQYYQGNNSSENHDTIKNINLNYDNSSQNEQTISQQNQQQSKYNYQQEEALSPQKRSNLKPPKNVNRSAENKQMMTNAVKLISTLNNIKQRDEDSEDHSHNNNNSNSNILSDQQQENHHGHHHSHNHLNVSKNETKQKNFQDRMIRERIKAAEKSFVVGRIKADDSRLTSNLRKNKTDTSVDENGDNQEQENVSNLQKGNLSTKGRNIQSNLDKKDLRNNSQGLSSTNNQKKNPIIKGGQISKPQNQTAMSSQPSQSSLKKTTTFFNNPTKSNPQTAEQNANEINNNQHQQLDKPQSSQQTRKEAAQQNKKLNTEGDLIKDKEGDEKCFDLEDQGQDRESAKVGNSNKIVLKLNQNQSDALMAQVNKKVQLPQQDGSNQESNPNHTQQDEQDNKRTLQKNKDVNANNDGSKSPIDKSQRRQIRSYSSKGFASNKSRERLNKSINRTGGGSTLLPNLQQKQSQNIATEGDDSSDSLNGLNKSKLTDGTRKKRSSHSQINIHEKKLIDEGLKLKQYNNMDLILSKITKTHNQRGNPYQDPLTQQIFTKQFTEIFVKKMEKKRKNQKKTDYDYVDAAKVYYSVCDGSNLTKPEIGRGQKYLIEAAQKKQPENNASQQDKKQIQYLPSQTSLHNNNPNNFNNTQNSSKQLSQPYFKPSTTFSAPSQQYPHMQQSESSPTLITGQRQGLGEGGEPESSQQSFRTTQNGLSPQKKFAPLFMGARNNTQTPIYFNFIAGNDNNNSFYPISTSTTHSFYPHSHFHRVNPFSGISGIQTQRDRSPFNMSSHINDTNYGQSNNYSQQDLLSPNQIANNDQQMLNANSTDYPISTNNNQSSSNILDKSRNTTQFTSTGKLILPKLSLNPNNMDPDLQNAVKCSKILQYLNEGDIPSQKKKKPAIDAAEREKARSRLLGKDKESQPKSIRQQKEDERKRQDDEKFNGPTKRGRGENGSMDASIIQKGTNDNSIISSDQSKPMPVKKIPKISEEYHNFTVSLTQNYNETVSIVLRRGYPEENDQSLLKVDQLSKDNFKNFQWRFDEVWFPQGNDLQNQRIRVLKGRDEKIKQKCSFHFFNCSDLGTHKDYLKDVSISYMINLQYEKDRVRNPTLLMYSIPNIFQQNKKELEFVTQQEYYSTLECILEYRHQIRQEWGEEEMISMFYSLLDCMNELQTLNISHGNITPANIAYSYKTNRYKIFNFSSAQVHHKDYRGGYPIYYQWPFIAPEVKKGLSFNSSKSNRYDILASDLYSLGISFLMVKYLIPENMRSQEAIARLISTVESDNRLSALIIRSLINKQQTKRVENAYAKLCHLIHSTITKSGQQFNPYQKQDLFNLNPLHKLKWKQNKDNEVIADFYYRIFQWQNAADRLKKMLDELIELEKGESNLSPSQKEKKQRILRDVWKSYFKQQEYENAVKYNQMYMELLSQTPEEMMKDKQFLESLAEDLKMTAQLYFTVQQSEKAIHFFDKTIQVLTDLHGPNHIEVVSMLNNIGVLYKSLQNYEKSLSHFQQALQIMESTRSCEDDLYFFIKYNIGIIYFEQEELTQAENVLYEIYKIKTTEHKVKSVEVSQYAYILGNVYIKKNHLPKAQQIIEIAIKMREACIGYDGELIKWKQLLANVCFQLGQRKEAMDILIKTVSDVKKMRHQPQSSNPDGEDATYNAIEDIGNMILETGNKKEALKFYHEALQLAKNQQDKQTGIIGALEKKIKEVKK